MVVSIDSRRAVALPLVVGMALLLSLTPTHAAVHAYHSDSFERVNDAWVFYAGREGMLASEVSGVPAGKSGVHNGASYVRLNEVVFSRTKQQGETPEGTTIEAVLFESRDSNRIGYVANGEEKRRLCCTTVVASEFGCTPGRVVLGEDVVSSVWHSEADFDGDDGTAKFRASDAQVQHAVHVDGMYELLFISCDDSSDVSEDEPSPSISPYTISGQSVWKNPHGYLPGRKTHDRFMFGATVAVYVVLAATWVWAFALKVVDSGVNSSTTNLRGTLNVHLAVSLVLLLGMSEYSTRYSNAVAFNDTGTKPFFLVIFASVVSAARESVSRLCVLCACLGLGITRPSLGDNTTKFLSAITAGYFLSSLVLDLDEQRIFSSMNSYGRVGVASDAHDDVQSGTRELLALPVALLNAVFIVHIFTALSKTLQKTQVRRQWTKLAVYKDFANSLAAFIVASVFLSAFETFLVVSDGGGETAAVSSKYFFAEQFPYWQWEWTITDGWIAIEVGVLCVCMWLWRPGEMSDRYAYVERGNIGDDFGDGAGMKIGDSKNNHLREGLMLGTPGRGIALTQTPIRDRAYLEYSSDEETKME